MRGSVVRRGNMWTVVVELERDPITGKRRQRWHSGYRTKKEAERARIGLRAGLTPACTSRKAIRQWGSTSTNG